MNVIALLGILVALLFIVWYWGTGKGKKPDISSNTINESISDRMNRGIPESMIPTPEPLNSDIISKLETVEKRIRMVEVQTKVTQKSVSNIDRWLWLLPIGYIMGLYWDNIVAFFKNIFQL